MSNTKRIAELNDEFRTSGKGGRVMVTCGVAALGALFQMLVIAKVREFSDFDEDNNPHGERDFGSFALQGQKCFFKIDYYDPSMEAGSEDPSDPAKTTRVLTVMLAEEY